MIIFTSEFSLQDLCRVFMGRESQIVTSVETILFSFPTLFAQLIRRSGSGRGSLRNRRKDRPSGRVQRSSSRVSDVGEKKDTISTLSQ